jgi:hypothetical protein
MLPGVRALGLPSGCKPDCQRRSNFRSQSSIVPVTWFAQSHLIPETELAAHETGPLMETVVPDIIFC